MDRRSDTQFCATIGTLMQLHKKHDRMIYKFIVKLRSTLENKTQMEMKMDAFWFYARKYGTMYKLFEFASFFFFLLFFSFAFVRSECIGIKFDVN